MRIMVTSFKRSHVRTSALSAPNPAAGHCWHTPPPETPGHTWESLSQSLLGSLLLSPGSWCTWFFLCSPRVCFPMSCVSSGGSMVVLMATSSKTAYPIPRSAAPRAPARAAVHCWPVPPQFSSVVAQSCLTLRPHGLQHTRLPCPLPTPGFYTNSCPLSWWCHPTISSSVIPFSSCLQYFPSSGFVQVSQFFISGANVLEFQLRHQSFQWTPRTNLL